MVALAAGGCSWGARGYRAVASTSTQCSSSRAAPIVDTALAVAGAAAVGYGFSDGFLDDSGADDNRSKIVGAGFLGALVFGASAISGYTWAGDCRRAPRETASIARQ
jgi:hypothetical protein